MLAGRSSIVRRAERVDVECVVRSYLAGSGWKEYEAQCTLAEERWPAGIPRAGKLDRPRFTPAVKNDVWHDQNISRLELSNRVGKDMATTLEDISLRLYTTAAAVAQRAGFIIADTKFEFGIIDGQVALIDEALTPDSSRYWNAEEWESGVEPASFDKQVVRDWLEASGWDKQFPGPVLPEQIIRTATDRYRAVRDRLFAAKGSFQEIS